MSQFLQRMRNPTLSEKMISNSFHSTYFDFPWVFEISLAEPYKEQKAQTGN